MRIAIRVRPGSARPGAGGEHAGALIVRVSAQAVDGKAMKASLAAVDVLAALQRGPPDLLDAARHPVFATTDRGR